ncbi:MAG: hypothetical protein JNN27_17640 [Planctomycetes bacterium]|nr:hypothetical protein [Planctomycetota bacterium]
MGFVIRRWWWAAAAGALVGTLLLALSARPWIASTSLSPDLAAELGRVVAVALWLHVVARLRTLSAARTASEVFLLVAASGLLNAIVVTTAIEAAGQTVALWVGDQHGPALLWTAALRHSLFISILAACLFETLRDARALATGFLALSWVLPALVGGSVRDFAGNDAATDPQSTLLDLAAFACAAVAASGAWLALKAKAE